MAASYRKAITRIALEDEPGEMDVDTIQGMVSVALVADLFEKDSETIAKAVRRYREKQDV